MTLAEGERKAQDLEGDRRTRERLVQLGHLYRYVGLDGERFARLFDVVLRSKLYFVPFGKLNDPNDSIMPPTLEGTEEQQRATWERSEIRLNRKIDNEGRRRIEHVMSLPATAANEAILQSHNEERNKLAIVCLSERPNIDQMWKQYANEHRGVCLRFRHELFLACHDGGTPALKVQYGGAVPSLHRSGPGILSRVLAYKSEAWRHEEEWRVVNTTRGEWAFDPTMLDGIILGSAIDPRDADRVRTMAALRNPVVEILNEAEPQRRLRGGTDAGGIPPSDSAIFRAFELPFGLSSRNTRTVDRRGPRSRHA